MLLDFLKSVAFLLLYGGLMLGAAGITGLIFVATLALFSTSAAQQIPARSTLFPSPLAGDKPTVVPVLNLIGHGFCLLLFTYAIGVGAEYVLGWNFYLGCLIAFSIATLLPFIGIWHSNFLDCCVGQENYKTFYSIFLVFGVILILSAFPLIWFVWDIADRIYQPSHWSHGLLLLIISFYFVCSPYMLYRWFIGPREAPPPPGDQKGIANYRPMKRRDPRLISGLKPPF